MLQIWEGNHLNQQISGHLNSLSYLNQIIGQQENPVSLEIQDQLMVNLLQHLLSQINQQFCHHRIHLEQETP
jgi:uncharacterized protein YbcI